MVGECTRQHLYELGEEQETTLSRLDALLLELFVDRPHDEGDLYLQLRHGAVNGETLELL